MSNGLPKRTYAKVSGTPKYGQYYRAVAPSLVVRQICMIKPIAADLSHVSRGGRFVEQHSRQIDMPRRLLISSILEDWYGRKSAADWN